MPRVVLAALGLARLVDHAVERDVEAGVAGRDLLASRPAASVAHTSCGSTGFDAGHWISWSVTGTGFDCVRFSSRAVRPSVSP